LTAPTSVSAGGTINYSVEVVNLSATADGIRLEVDLTDQDNNIIHQEAFEAGLPPVSPVTQNYSYTLPTDGSVREVKIQARGYHWQSY